MSHCPYCGEEMRDWGDGELVCPYECLDDCPDCGDVIGECHEEGQCYLTFRWAS